VHSSGGLFARRRRLRLRLLFGARRRRRGGLLAPPLADADFANDVSEDVAQGDDAHQPAFLASVVLFFFLHIVINK
jgi:hypothetical protein